jgi:uncharacterized protein YukE
MYHKALAFSVLVLSLLIASIPAPIASNGDIYVRTDKDVYSVGETVKIEAYIYPDIYCICFEHEWYVYVARIENELCSTYIVKEWWWKTTSEDGFRGKTLYWKASEEGNYEVVANLITHNSSVSKTIQVIGASSPQRLLKVTKVYASPSSIKPGMSSTLNYEFEAIESGYVDKFILYVYVDTPQGLRLIASDIFLEGKEVSKGQMWAGNTYFSIPYDALSGSVIALFYNAPVLVVPLSGTELPSNVEIFSVARVEVENIDDWKEKYDELKEQYDKILQKYNDLKSDYDDLNRRYGDLNDRYQSLMNQVRDLQRRVENLNSLYEQLNDLKAKFASTSSLAMFLSITTAIFLITTIFFAIKRRKEGLPPPP